MAISGNTSISSSQNLINSLMQLQQEEQPNVAVNNSAVAIAKEMSDDLSALLSSFMQRRVEHKGSQATNERRLTDLVKDKPQSKEIQGIFANKHISANPGEILKNLQQHFGDYADVALWLKAAIKAKKRKKKLDDSSNHELVAEIGDVPLPVLEQAYTQLLSQEGSQELKAAINIQREAEKFSTNSGLDIKEVREIYRDFLSQQEAATKTYARMLQKVSSARRYQAVEFIQNALHADVNAYDPSCNLSEFSNILGSVFRLQLIKAGDYSFTTSFRTDELMHESLYVELFSDLINHPDDTQDVLVSFLEKHFRFSKRSEKVNFLQQVIFALNSVHPDIFESDELKGYEVKRSILQTISEMIQVLSELLREGRVYG